MNIWTSFVHVVYEQVFFPKVLMCNRWFYYSWKIINALKKLIFKNILFILVGLALIVIGAYIQIAAKEFLDFLSDNYLNTPIFIIIIGKKKLIFIIIIGKKKTYFHHYWRWKTNLFSIFKKSKAFCVNSFAKFLKFIQALFQKGLCLVAYWRIHELSLFH